MVELGISGDIFIHAGDFTSYGKEKHFRNLMHFLPKLNFKHKIVIAGNHEIFLDPTLYGNRVKKLKEKHPCSVSVLVFS